ncbi:AraC family transcriptional regulator [Streptomyces sp. SGAir0957]
MKQAWAGAPTMRVSEQPSGVPLCSYRQCAAGPMALAKVTTRPEFVGLIESNDLLALTLIHSGTVEINLLDGPERYAAGDIFAAIGPGLNYRCVTKNLTVSVLTLPGLLLTEAAGLEDVAKPWQFLAREPVDEAAADLWRATTSYVGRLLDSPLAVTSPLLAAAAARMTAVAALKVFPTTLTVAPTRTDGADATPETLRRAVAFIENNADQGISLTDVAAAAYVTPRALQYAFRRHLDTTPIAHLRRVRLDAAHAELLAADPCNATVSDIAARWGFGRRFSALYQAAYRVPPSRTLNHPP